MVNKKRKVDEDSEENSSKKSKATKSISKKNIKEDEIIDETKKGKKIFLENGFVLLLFFGIKIFFYKKGERDLLLKRK